MKKSVCGNLTLLLLGLLFSCSMTYAEGPHITIEMIKSDDAVSVKKAIAEGADVNAIVRDPYEAYNYSLLMLAAKSNALSVAELLINNGANINQDINGLSVLFLAIETKSFKMVKLLLDHGVPVNPIKERSDSPLETAVIHGDVKIVRLLIERGANVRGKYLFLLSQAVAFNKVEIAKILVENGADLNESDTDGETPLIIAVEMESYDMVKFLLEKGADVSRKDGRGDTVVQHAHGNNKKIIDLLRHHGVKIGFFKYAQSRLGYPFNEMPILLLITVFFILFVTWILLAAKLTRKIDVFIIKFVIRTFGLLLILSPLPLALMFSMGRRGPPPLPLNILILSLLILFISGFGMLFLKMWSWYSAVVSVSIYLVAALFDVGSLYFFTLCYSPTLLLLCFLIPKVKEQFR